MSRPQWLKPPVFLDEKAATHWKNLAPGLYRAGYLTAERSHDFLMLSVWLATRDALAAAIGQQGATIRSASGAIKANPAMRALMDVEKRLRDLLREFGLNGTDSLSRFRLP